MNGLGGGGHHHHHRGGGFYPYPYPIQYPGAYAERILLVEPDPGKDPCPPQYVLSKTSGRCVKVARGLAKGAAKKQATHGLGAIDIGSISLSVWAIAAVAGYFLFLRK